MKMKLSISCLILLLTIPVCAQGLQVPITQFNFKGCASYLCQMQPERQGTLDISNPVTGVTIHFAGRWSGVGVSVQTLNLNNGEFSIITPVIGRLLGNDLMTNYRILGTVKIVNEYTPNPKSPMDIFRLGLYTSEPIRVQNVFTQQTVYTLDLKDLYAPASISANAGTPATYNVNAVGATGLGVLTSLDITQAVTPRDALKLLSVFYTLPQRTTGRR